MIRVIKKEELKPFMILVLRINGTEAKSNAGSISKTSN
jgi:hypothetical protein